MSIGELYDASGVTVGQAATLFAPENTPLPDLASWDVTDPFKLAFWTDSPQLWTPCGATDQGWTFGADKSTQTITIEEQSTPVDTTLTSQSVSIAGSLSEDITRTLALALNATSAATAATTTAPGYDTINLSDTVIKYAVAMVTVNSQGFGRITYAPQWTQLNNVSAAFRRAADKRMYAVQFSTVCDIGDIEIINFTAAPTA